MHQPPLFRETRTDVLETLIERHPFAMLITTNQGAITADHLPLTLHRDKAGLGLLRGHVAASNPLGQADLSEVLVVFQGPHAYVSPGWYPSKIQHGKVVPTWNYAVVHARGTLKVQRDPDWIWAHLNELTDQHEHNRAVPWSVTDAPDTYIARLMTALTGFEIQITSLEGVWKTSQNKSELDRRGVEKGLRRDQTAATLAMADLMANPRS